MGHYFTNNDNLKSEFRTIIYKRGDEITKFTSDLGVFSKHITIRKNTLRLIPALQINAR